MPRPRVILESAVKTQRIKVRKELGSLHDLVVSPKTLTRYKQAVQTFLEWLRANRFKMLSDFIQIDELVSNYICECWEEGEARSLVANLLSGLQHESPSLKRNLNSSWRLLGAWARREMPILL